MTPVLATALLSLLQGPYLPSPDSEPPAKRAPVGIGGNGRRALLCGDRRLRLPSRHHRRAPADFHLGHDGARHLFGGGKHLAQGAFPARSRPAVARPEAGTLLSRARRHSRTGDAPEFEIHRSGRPGMPGLDRKADERTDLRGTGRLGALSAPARDTRCNRRGRPARTWERGRLALKNGLAQPVLQVRQRA